jgi:transcriptional regulator with XRE-family HTH domain
VPFLLHNISVKISEAVALRINELLRAHGWTLYKLEKESGGAWHDEHILYGRNKSVTLAVLIQISKGFGITYQEFLNSPLLDENNLDVE